MSFVYVQGTHKAPQMVALHHGLVKRCFHPTSPPSLWCFEDWTERNRDHLTEIEGLDFLNEGSDMP